MNQKPNILLILTDQQRWDTLGCAGNAQIQTPHLDALAADGVRFPNSFCPFPVCTPSRYSLLSGLYVHQHGGWNNRCTLAHGVATFPRLLRAAGYRTQAVGKMHFTPTYLDVGFDHLELAEQDGEGRLDDDYHRDLRDNGLLDSLDLIDQRAEFRERAPEQYWQTFGAQTSELPEEWHSTTWIANRTLRVIDGWSNGGNLLMAGFIKPHHPFDPPAPWDAMYDPNAIELLPGWADEIPARDRAHRGYFPNEKLNEAALRRITAYYYATISQIDHHVGRIVARLKERGLYESTLIVFTSDHGEYLGFHHLLLKSGPMYDPLMRVPLLLKLPQNQQAGSVRDTMACNIDLAPTLLHQAGIEPPPGMTGLDLSDAAADRPCVFASSVGRRHMVRTRTHKLMLSANSEQCAFFDLQRDPLERTNLCNEPQAQPLIAQHQQALMNWVLFEAPSPVYLDQDARKINAPNVPRDDSHREGMRRYFEQHATPYLNEKVHDEARKVL